jgi:hypothetical protein
MSKVSTIAEHKAEAMKATPSKQQMNAKVYRPESAAKYRSKPVKI